MPALVDSVDTKSLQTVVNEAKAQVEKDVPHQTGVYLQFSGQAEAEQATRIELSIYTAATLVLIVMILFLCFNRPAHPWLVLVNLPFSLIGSIVAIGGDHVSVVHGQLSINGVTLGDRKIENFGEHEAFLKLVDQHRVDWQSRTHFFGLAAQLMRRILVDHARRTGRDKRGADVVKVSLDLGAEPDGAAGPDLADILTLDRALDDLEHLDPRQCRIVELRFFSGLNVEETAEAMKLSTGTIKREWAVARAWRG